MSLQHHRPASVLCGYRLSAERSTIYIYIRVKSVMGNNLGGRKHVSSLHSSRGAIQSRFGSLRASQADARLHLGWAGLFSPCKEAAPVVGHARIDRRCRAPLALGARHNTTGVIIRAV